MRVKKGKKQIQTVGGENRDTKIFHGEWERDNKISYENLRSGKEEANKVQWLYQGFSIKRKVITS